MKLTREMIIPAILIRIRGPFNKRYRKSTPFQNDTKYRLIYKQKEFIQFLCNVKNTPKKEKKETQKFHERKSFE